MKYTDPIKPEKVPKAKPVQKPTAVSETIPCVMESVPGTPGNQKIEKLLSDILARLEHIEEKIDEADYPPESAIRPAYVRKIKAIDSELAKKTGKTYPSMEEFIRNIKQ